jgi:hypothetical protein
MTATPVRSIRAGGNDLPPLPDVSRVHPHLLPNASAIAAGAALAWRFRNSGALRRFMRKAAEGAPVTVTVLGGSMTAGILCADGERVLQNCSWSARVASWVADFLSAPRVTYNNLARGATTLVGFLPAVPHVLWQLQDRVKFGGASGGLDGTSLLLLDFSINDAYEYDSPRLSGAKAFSDPRHAEEVSIATERLLMAVRSIAPFSAVVGVTWPCGACGAVQQAYARVYEHYAIPSMDLTLLPSSRPQTQHPQLQTDGVLHAGDGDNGEHHFWPTCRGPPSECFGRRLHPTFEWHQLYAHMFSWGLRQVLLQDNESPVATSTYHANMSTHWPAKSLKRYAMCMQPHSTYWSARDAYIKSLPLARNDINTTGTGSDSGPGTTDQKRATTSAGSVLTCKGSLPSVVGSERCRLVAARADKPVWRLQGEGGAGARASSYIEFSVDFGVSPVLMVSYIRSFEGSSHRLGDGQLEINGVSYTLVTSHRSSATQLHTEFFDVSRAARHNQDASMATREAQLMGRPLGDAGAVGFGVKPHSSGVSVRISLAPPRSLDAKRQGVDATSGLKFELAGISAC